MTKASFEQQLSYLKAHRQDIKECLDDAYTVKNWDEIEHYEDMLMQVNHQMADLRIAYLMEVR